ncbi:MAG: DUF1464 family protein [Dehalococcoidales bacterium]|nr:DUF1464 family protein [Dehalococcoidales bacterium]
MKILGIDPGTVSFDLCLLEDEKIRFEASIPSRTVAEKPETLAAQCFDLKPDVIVAPSGYGLPNRRLKDLTAREMFELTLVREGEKIPVLEGMKKFFAIVRQRNLECLFLPGVLHLPTVPRWRKINKIDMGTADKMAIAALSVEMAARQKHTGYADVNHIVVEMGGGYNCVMAIENGRIINGIGGTLFPGPSFMNSGAMDGELAYLLGGFEKGLLFQGGVSTLAGVADLAISDFNNEAYPEAFNAFLEGVLFAVCSQRPLVPGKEVYLSGRLTSYENIYTPVRTRLEKLGYSVNPLPVMSQKSKAAAQGYAVVGNGICGGCFTPLVKHMMIDRAEGSVTDYVVWKDRI